MMPSPKAREVVVAREATLYAAMITIWGSSYFFIAVALDVFSPLMLVLTRLVLATLTLATVVGFRRLTLPRDRRVLGHFLVLGALNIAIPFSLITSAQVYVSSSLTSVLSATTPVFVFLIACMVTPSERFTPLRASGIAIAFLGMVVMTGVKSGGGQAELLWALVVLVSSMIFATGNVYTRTHLSGIHPFVVAFGQISVGMVYMLTLTLLLGKFHIPDLTLPATLAILELGVLGSGFAYLLFFHFILRWGSTTASFNTYLQPPVGLLLGVVVLGETIPGRGWLALSLILAGLLVFGSGTLSTTNRPNPQEPQAPIVR